MHQTTPKVSDADIERLLIRDFGAVQLNVAREILSGYGSGERHRVMAAALKLADGDLESLKHYVEQANSDYRDILMWAEYWVYQRVESALSYKVPIDLKQLASVTDSQNYQYWFHRLASDPKIPPASSFRDATDDDHRWSQAMELLDLRIREYHPYESMLSTSSQKWRERFDILLETTFFATLAEFEDEANFIIATLKTGSQDHPREIRRYRWSRVAGVSRID